MKANNDSSNTILGLLGIAFIILKLTGVINWSWWLVTLPFWAGLAIMIFICLSIFVVKMIKGNK